MHGNFMDRVSRVPQAGNEAVRAFFYLDVSHIWNGCLFPGALPSPEKQMCPGAGDSLCHCHFYCGISDGKPPEEERDLSMELRGMPL